MSFHEEWTDVFAEALKKTITVVGDCADMITKVGQRIDTLVARMDTMVLHMDTMVVRMDAMVVRTDAMVARMDNTDERWNQLIDQLTREHQNAEISISRLVSRLAGELMLDWLESQSNPGKF